MISVRKHKTLKAKAVEFLKFYSLVFVNFKDKHFFY